MGQRCCDREADLNGEAVRAFGVLVADGIPPDELVGHVRDLMEALEEECRVRALREARTVPAEALSRMRRFPGRVRGFSNELAEMLKRYGCAADDYLLLDADWIKEGDVPPTPSGTRWPVRLRFNVLPALLRVAAERLPNGNVSASRPGSEPEEVELAEHALVRFVRDTSTSGTPHYCELADLISTLIPNWLGDAYEPRREFHEVAMSQRDYRRRKQVEEDEARSQSQRSRTPTNTELEQRRQLAAVLARRKS